MQSWNELFSKLLNQDKFVDLRKRIKERRKKIEVYPNPKEVFLAYNLTSYNSVKVVIIGQDPYPTKGFAHGLAFSSLTEKTPKSLQNIFKEIYRTELKDKTPEECFKTNNLTCWAKQGVLLINAILTVEKDNSLSHENWGWEDLTKEVILSLNGHINPIVFLLWGNYAKKYKEYITDKKHLILESVHPSPMNNNFIGNDHFKKTNDFIKYNNPDQEIDLRQFFDENSAMNYVLKHNNMSDNDKSYILNHVKEKILWNLDFFCYSPIDWRTY